MPRGVPAKYQEIDGVLHKECFGPYHKTLPHEKRWTPVSKFPPVRTGRPSQIGKPQAWCQACLNFRKSKNKGQYNPRVPREQFIQQLEYCVERLGINETAERLGLAQNSFWQLRKADWRKGASLRTVKAIYDLWGELRKTGERRSKNDIHHGTTKRGKEEKRSYNLTGGSDPLVVNTEELAKLLHRWIIETDADFEDVLGNSSRMSARSYLLEKTGHDHRVLFRILNAETKFTALSLADDFLTAAGLGDWLVGEGGLAVVPNPRWNQEKWQTYMEAQGWDSGDVV